MKNKWLFILIPLMLLMSLTSCIFNVNHQTNFFIEGNFISEDNNYYFDVKEIAKNKYDLENNINVISDKVLKHKHFFKLKFYTYQNSEEKIINIVNLRDFFLIPQRCLFLMLMIKELRFGQAIHLVKK